jgi:hypothetical protein
MVKSKEYYYNRLNISLEENYSFHNPKFFIKNSLDYLFDQYVIRGELEDLENFENFIFKILPWYANVLICNNSFGHFVNTTAFLVYYLDRTNYQLYSKSLTVNSTNIKLDKLSVFGNPLAWRNVLIEKKVLISDYMLSTSFTGRHDSMDNVVLFPFVLEPTTESCRFIIRMCAHEFPNHYRILNPPEANRLKNIGVDEYFAH